MSTTRNANLPRTLVSAVAKLAALAVLAIAIFGGARTSEARLDPYYILRGQSFTQVKPRILFALDTSGSMSWLTTSDTACGWNLCESAGNADESRIAIARRVINGLVKDNKELADFGLMTFRHASPPTSFAEVPKRCFNFQYSVSPWSSWLNPPSSTSTWSIPAAHLPTASANTFTNPAPTNAAVSGNTIVGRTRTRFYWASLTDYGSTITNPFGASGAWVLCGDKRPYPYLRWDNLGFSGVAQVETTALPAAPLYAARSNGTQYRNWTANLYRRVQWFPRYLGNRVNLSCSAVDATAQDLMNRSFGDYRNASSENSNVCGHDFYYWPYVNGFTGYSQYQARYPSSGITSAQIMRATNQQCSGNGSCTEPGSSTLVNLGVMRANHGSSNNASLFAPFYSAAAQTLPVAARGFATREAANMQVELLTRNIQNGGIDAHYSTPIRTWIGDADTFVNGKASATGGLTKDTAWVNSNGEFSHTSVASYLAFTVIANPNDLCVPTYAVMITDGEPTDMGFYDSCSYVNPSSGATASWYCWDIGMWNLSRLRTTLGVKTYVVGFTSGVSSATLNVMACAAAGKAGALPSAFDYESPCSGTSVGNWDTCKTPGSSTNCAFPTSDPASLNAALTQIVQSAIKQDVPAGPVSSVNEFIPSGGTSAPAQTTIRAYTESPDYRGRVIRAACTSGDASCTLANQPLATDAKDAESFAMGSSCGRSRAWDAGTCLQSRPWANRRIYSYTSTKQLYRISDASGNPTTTFRNELFAAGAIPSTSSTEAVTITQFILGSGWPGNWKLSGLGNSAPIVVRRIPKPNNAQVPSVGIRDAACAGRVLGLGSDVPPSLTSFASNADNVTLTGGGFAVHRQYQEAVLIGSDTGLMHAFNLDSGNEMFALLPRNLLGHVDLLAATGAATMGQPADVAQRRVGISTTLNQGYVWDNAANKWRHLGVFGFGKGGTEYVAMDLAQMGRLAEDQPVEILWTTDTVSTSSQTLYNDSLGETWSRPVLTYQAPNDSYTSEPRAFLVFGSGYRSSGATTVGRRLVLVDAVTGEAVNSPGRAVTMAAPPATFNMIDVIGNYGLVNDVAVATHCLSRFWGEMQEAYLADVAGRLYRWDLGSGASGTDLPHTADSVAQWWNGSVTTSTAQPLATFRACRSTSTTCGTIHALTGDPFLFPPAVVTKDRIDDITEAGQPVPSTARDQVLIAMASGSPYDDAIDAGKPGSDYWSSLYLMVDDHRGAAARAGLPAAATTNGGQLQTTVTASINNYLRFPVSAFTYTRTGKYPNNVTFTQTGTFNRFARPIAQPRIRVTGAVNQTTNQVIPDVEIYYITYFIYQPGGTSCNSNWYNATTGTFEQDRGSTYEVTLRFAINSNNPFTFNEQNVFGTSGTFNLGDGFGGLSAGAASQLQTRVTQVTEGCPNGNCGTQLPAKVNKPCAPTGGATAPPDVTSIPMSWSEIDGFSPLDR